MKHVATGAPEKKIGVFAVARALAIIDVFNSGEPALSLSEIARRAGLHRSTVLRIARTMAASRYLAQLPDGSWRLGAACGWAGSRYNVAFDAAIIEPVLRLVSRRTGSTASYYVREEWSRICIARVDAPQSPPDHVRIGEILPLDKGAAGGVLLAFSGEPGEPYERIRRLGYHSTLGDPKSRSGSVAYPVFGLNRALIGCISVFGPTERLNQKNVARCISVVREAAARLTFELGVSHSKRTRRRPRGL